MNPGSKKHLGEKPDRATRDWRMAMIGASFFSVGLLCLLLAACSGTQVRPETSSTPVAVATPTPLPPVKIPEPDIVADLPIPEMNAQPISPWQRLRDRYAMPGCNYSPMVQEFARNIASSPTNLQAALKQAMPFLLIVTAQIEKADMPGEFAFLPWVESSYSMILPSADGVAGMWQLMPQTARETGLQVDSQYDGRLDVYASTQTALTLLKQYHEEFGDWRLANMAFNAGVNSVRQAIGDPHTMTPAQIERLRLNQTNHEHLTKLLALSCIVANPKRFHVVLPQADADDVLAVMELPAPIDLHLAATLAGVNFAQLQRWNPAYLNARMSVSGPHRLLIPAMQAGKIERTLALMPQFAWRDWREVELREAQSVDMLSMAYDVDAHALATINHVNTSASLPVGKRVLLPGRGSHDDREKPTTESVATTVKQTHADKATCTVHPGDTLWTIAKRYRVRMEDLMHWNRLKHDSTLHLGQHLVVTAPARDG